MKNLQQFVAQFSFVKNSAQILRKSSLYRKGQRHRSLAASSTDITSIGNKPILELF